MAVSALLFMGMASGAFAQVVPSQAEQAAQAEVSQPVAPVAPVAPIVRSIEIQYIGRVSVSKKRIMANLRTQVGRPYSESASDEDVRALYKMGGISNARIFGEPTTRGVKVVVVVQGTAKIGQVLINGADHIKAKSIRKDLTVKPGQPLDEAKVEEDRQKIIDTYQSKGFANVAVKSDVRYEVKSGAAVVTYNIQEGQKTVITAVDFQGNTVFSSKVLRKVVKTRRHNFIMSIFTDAGKLKEETVQEDISALRDYYQNHGYLDVQVSKPDLVRAANGDTTIVYKITEGRQYHARHVAISGEQVFTLSQIDQKIKMKDGAVYSPEQVRADVKAIQDLYGQRGYIDLQVAPDTINAGNGEMDLTYRITEGTQSYVNQVNIIGNTKTQDKVIRRELAVAPGDVYDTTRVDVSKARLQNLNYFSRVDAYPSDTNSAGRKDLNVRVAEKPTGSLNFGAGFSSIDSLLGFAEISQSNFDLFNWPHFTGAGEHFSARVQIGTETKDVVIALTQPWFFDRKIAVGGQLFYHDADYYSNYYSNRDYGFELNTRKALTNFLTARASYRLENIGIYNVSSDASQYMKDQAAILTKSSVTVGLTHDTRDNVFLTHTGHRVDLSAYVSGGPLGGNEKIYGFDLQGTQYFKLPWNTIFFINGEAASVNGWDNGNVPIWDSLYLGGANNLRGFKFYDVSPKDNKGNSIGGSSMARVTLEYSWPIIERVRGAVFYDAGFVNAGSYDYGTNNLASDVGIGVRLNLPIGPVRVDYGIPIQRGNASGHSGQFNFNIGYQF